MTPDPLDNEIEQILFFQSGPQSSNILADWQIDQLKSAIRSLVEREKNNQTFKTIQALVKSGSISDRAASVALAALTTPQPHSDGEGQQ